MTRLSITPARTGCVTSAAVITTPIRVRGRRGKRGSRPPPQTPPSRFFMPARIARSSDLVHASGHRTILAALEKRTNLECRRCQNYEKSAREMSLPLFHHIMVFVDKVAADVGTLRMTFSRRVTVVTTNK